MVTVVAGAEDLDVPAGHFSLVVIGNAFHRLPRDPVARLAYGWLAPGGFIALCWSSGPGTGPLDWQLAFGSLLRRWQEALGASDRVPVNWNQARQDRPDTVVLSDDEFEVVGRFEFLVEHRWTGGGTRGICAVLVGVPGGRSRRALRRLRRLALGRARPFCR
jgi:hypothetical protein